MCVSVKRFKSRTNAGAVAERNKDIVVDMLCLRSSKENGKNTGSHSITQPALFTGAIIQLVIVFW